MSTPQFIEMKIDSGASANFHEVSHHLRHQPISTMNPSVHVIVPNGQIMTSISTANLPLPGLPSLATLSHGFPSLASGSLLSVGQICDNQCTAIFTDRTVRMYHNKDVNIRTTQPAFLSGTRNSPSQPLYSVRLPIPSAKTHSANLLLPSANATILPHLSD